MTVGRPAQFFRLDDTSDASVGECIEMLVKRLKEPLTALIDFQRKGAHAMQDGDLKPILDKYAHLASSLSYLVSWCSNTEHAPQVRDLGQAAGKDLVHRCTLAELRSGVRRTNLYSTSFLSLDNLEAVEEEIQKYLLDKAAYKSIETDLREKDDNTQDKAKKMSF